MNILPEFDDTTGEFFWNNNQKNSSQKSDNNEDMKKEKENGLNNEWLRSSILNPCSTVLPFNYDVLHSDAKQRSVWKKEIAQTTRGYGKFIDPSFEDFPMPSRLRGIVVFMFRHGLNEMAAELWMLWKRRYVAAHKKAIKDNICKK